MEYSINFVGIEGTEAMREKAQEIVRSKTEPFKANVQSVIVTVEKERDDYRCKATLHCVHNSVKKDLVLEKTDKEYYKALNLLGDDIRRGVRKFKEQALRK